MTVDGQRPPLLTRLVEGCVHKSCDVAPNYKRFIQKARVSLGLNARHTDSCSAFPMRHKGPLFDACRRQGRTLHSSSLIWNCALKIALTQDNSAIYSKLLTATHSPSFAETRFGQPWRLSPPTLSSSRRSSATEYAKQLGLPHVPESFGKRFGCQPTSQNIAPLKCKKVAFLALFGATIAPSDLCQ